MATDVMKGMEGGESPLRMAMDRASDTVKGAAKRFLGDGHTREEPLHLTGDMMVGRRRLRRVEVKLELLSYVDAQFRQRTSSDGTVLAPSREQLVEDLTNLVLKLEDKLFETEDYATPDGIIKKPVHNREPAKVD